MLGVIVMSVISRDVPNCPLCGYPAVMLDVNDDGVTKYFVYCLNFEKCGLATVPLEDTLTALKRWEEMKDYANEILREKQDNAM